MPFRIFLIYHSHIDIGYTERQERIAAYQADFIRQGVDLVLSDRQAQREGDNLFKFTAEGFWAVEQYLKKYGETGKQRLLDAVKTGRFELTGGYLHFTELLNMYNLNHSLDYAKKFMDENQLPAADVVMASDINGFSYGYADALADHGITRLVTNINPYHGAPPFGKPLVPFYWKAPSGRRILVWSGMAYHKANLLGMIPGLSLVGAAGIPGMRDGNPEYKEIRSIEDYASHSLFELVKGLKEQGYAYDFLPVMGSGLYTDNSPAEDGHCDMVAAWNATYGKDIEIVTATVGEFFDYLESHVSNLPEYAGDWNDWWSDGTLSTPKPLRLFRNAQRIQTLLHKLSPEISLSPDDDESISGNLIHYAEHTWGHSASNAAPCHLLVQQLEYRKTQYAVQADIAASTLLDKACRLLGEGEFVTSRPFAYSVINPHNIPLNTVVYLPVDYWEEVKLHNGFHVADEQGNTYPGQQTATLRGTFIAVSVALLPKEKKILQIVLTPYGDNTKSGLHQEAGAFENDYYRLSYSKDGITGLYNKRQGCEALRKDGRRLGQPIYQVFPGGERGFGANKESARQLLAMQQTHDGVPVQVDILEDGPVFTTIKITYTIPGASYCAVFFRLFTQSPKIEMHMEVYKDLVMDAEGLYLALPFQIDGGQWYLDKAGAFITLDEHLPGTCCDYFTVQKGIALANKQWGIAINTLDTPLVMFDDLKLWHFSTETSPDGCAYSWILNNKWNTNFKTECAGCHESRYVLQMADSLHFPQDCLDIMEGNDIEPLVLRHS